MLRTIERQAKVLGYAAAVASATCCSTYDSELLSQAEGGHTVELGDGDGDSGRSGGAASGGEPGDGDDFGGAPASGGAEGGTGGASSDGGSEGTGGDPSTGGDGNCVMGDCCPDDPEKDDPGQCGCGKVDADSDDDMTADCNDGCPEEPTKTEPGACGCGVSADDDLLCGVLKSGMIHRYGFNDSGAQVVDAIGATDGTIQNGGTQSGGLLSLDGTDQYVELPAGMISSLTTASFEFWFTWNGGNNYQRLFDFGDSEGDPVVGKTYLYLAVSKTDEGPGSGFSLVGNSMEVETEATDVIATGTKYHIVLVADESEGSFSLYIDGVFQSGFAFSSSLTSVNDISCYLGRSQFEADAYFNGSIDEFRMYDVALSRQQIAYSFAQGPDATVFN